MDADDEVLEHTLLLVREVHVYRVPPQSTSGGYKCAEWLVSSKIWSGRLRVVSVRDTCEIRLEDPNSGELFATCRVQAGQREASVQNAVDSSRYFVLKIDDGRGRHAFIGLGFNERNEAFDFNVALSDHEKHAHHEKSGPPDPYESAAPQSSPTPAADFKLKEGETIRINMKPTSTPIERPLGVGVGASQGLKPLAPPPGGAGFRLAPPPASGAGFKLAPPPSAATPLASFPAPAPSNTNNGKEGTSAQKKAAPTQAAGWTSF